METITTMGNEPRRVDAGRGTVWWTDAWALFTRQALMWIVLSLILLVIFVVLSVVPLVGSLAASLLMPVFIGSWMLAARKAAAGGTLEAADLFVCFKEKFSPLLVLGALLLAASIIIFGLAGMLGVGAVMSLGPGGQHLSAGGAMAALGAGALALVVGLCLGLVVAMALWFAPALVVFRNMAPVEALTTSLSAVLKNTVPFLIYGLLYIVAAIIASIPFGLGWIVLVPVVLLTTHASYQDVFGS